RARVSSRFEAMVIICPGSGVATVRDPYSVGPAIETGRTRRMGPGLRFAAPGHTALTRRGIAANFPALFRQRIGNHDSGALRRPDRRAEMAEGLGRGKNLRDKQRRSAPQILCAGDVPLSVGAHPYGPCPQL